MEAQDPSVSTESNGGALVATAAVMTGLTWFSICLRGYVRAILVKSFQADDWMLLAAQINFTISCGFILRGCYHGLGRHNKSLPQPAEIQALKYQALATATYVLNMWLIKLSIAIFLLRIAVQRRYRWIIYVSVSVITAWSLALFLWDVFQCTPVPAQWDYTILDREPPGGAACASAGAVVMAAYALSVMNVLSDWLYALLPIPMIWNVRMTVEAKLTVSLVLGLGIFASVATLVRLKFLADLGDTSDILHTGTDAMVWTLIEPGVAIIASSLATIRPLLRALGIRGFQLTDHSMPPRGLSGITTHPKTNQSQNDGRGGGSCCCMPGSADATLSDIDIDIELAHNAPMRTLSDAARSPANHRSLPPKALSTTARRMPRVEEARGNKDGPPPPPPPPRDTVGGGAGYRRIEILRNETGALDSKNDISSRTPAISQTLRPGQVWLDSSERFSATSRDSSVDFAALQPRHSQSDIPIGLGTHRTGDRRDLWR